MSHSEKDTQQDKETLEHLLGVVIESREKRCAEVRDKAHQQQKDIIRQAYELGRARLHRHVNGLREKYRIRVSAATARNQTLLRKQHQKKDRAILDVAWPLLREAMLKQWNNKQSRRNWLDAAIAKASSMLITHHWHIEFPSDLDEEELNRIKQGLTSSKGKGPKFVAKDDIAAGIRISTHGTVIDATLEGLLKQKTLIEAELIARVKQGVDGNE
jgi:hypothetical protein